jgi:hypothetical protein
MGLQGLDWKEDAQKAELMGPEFQLGLHSLISNRDCIHYFPTVSQLSNPSVQNFYIYFSLEPYYYRTLGPPLLHAKRQC